MKFKVLKGVAIAFYTHTNYNFYQEEYKINVLQRLLSVYIREIPNSFVVVTETQVRLRHS